VSNGIQGVCERYYELLPQNAKCRYVCHFEEICVFATRESQKILSPVPTNVASVTDGVCCGNCKKRGWVTCCLTVV
jgi:hypothetical protein